MKKMGSICLLVICVFVFACTAKSSNQMAPELSQVPVPTGFNLKTQQKVQSVQHWQSLASEVAEKIDKRLEERITKRHNSIYVAPSGNTPFEKGFRKLLISELVEKGLNVTHKNGNHMLLSFEVETFVHKERLRRTSSGTYMALMPGISTSRMEDSLDSEKIKVDPRKNMEAGKYTHELPRREILITTSLMYQGEFVARDSSVFYINDKEWLHYQNRKKEKDYKAKNYQIVSD